MITLIILWKSLIVSCPLQISQIAIKHWYIYIGISCLRNLNICWVNMNRLQSLPLTHNIRHQHFKNNRSSNRSIVHTIMCRRFYLWNTCHSITSFCMMRYLCRTYIHKLQHSMTESILYLKIVYANNYHIYCVLSVHIRHLTKRFACVNIMLHAQQYVDIFAVYRFRIV